MLVEKLKANSAVASVAAGDLALDPDFHPGRTSLELGADLRVLQVTPRQKH